mgnify:CR=1 FL=1
MRFTFIPELFRQFFSKPFTNLFPVKYAPASIKETLEKVEKGEIKIVPPVEIPDRETFRGKIQYDKEKCIGCKLCIKVCPAKAIEFKEEEKKIRIYIGRCIFCGQCVDICPTGAIKATKEFKLIRIFKVVINYIVFFSNLFTKLLNNLFFWNKSIEEQDSLGFKRSPGFDFRFHCFNFLEKSPS